MVLPSAPQIECRTKCYQHEKLVSLTVVIWYQQHSSFCLLECCWKPNSLDKDCIAFLKYCFKTCNVYVMCSNYTVLVWQGGKREQDFELYDIVYIDLLFFFKVIDVCWLFCLNPKSHIGGFIVWEGGLMVIN